MKVTPNFDKKTQPPAKQDDVQKKLKLVRAGHGIADSLAKGDLEKAFSRTIVSGIKLASDSPFSNPLASPLEIAGALKKLGISALVWKPETLFSAIDRQFHGWTDDRAGQALEHFHETGIIQTDVPLLVRQKIYALRVVATSDTAHNEWHIFEKVGCAFNDRVAQFGVVEKLSPAECAKTISVIEHVRPDDYSKEVKIYVAAACHEDGLLTVAPSKYLSMADGYLDDMNRDVRGERLPHSIKEAIEKRLKGLKESGLQPLGLTDDVSYIQALKLLAIDASGDEAAV